MKKPKLSDIENIYIYFESKDRVRIYWKKIKQKTPMCYPTELRLKYINFNANANS